MLKVRSSVFTLMCLGLASGASGLTFSDSSPSADSGLWAPVVDPDNTASGLYVNGSGNSYSWYQAGVYLVTGFPHQHAADVFWGAGSRYTGGTVNPSVDGEIASIDFSISSKKGSYNGVRVAMLMIQNGKYYRSNFFTQAAGSSTPLEVFTSSGLAANGFGEFVGKAYQYNPPAVGTADFNSNPDFTATGTTIQFGYLAHYDSSLDDPISAVAYQFTTAWSTNINFGIAVTGWAANNSGDWNDPANWVGAVPNAIDAVATLGNVIGANQTIYTNQQVRVGTLKFDSPFQYNLGGTGSLGIDVSTGSGSIQVSRGDQKINLPLFIYDNTTADVASGATLTIADPLTVNAGTTLTKTGAGAMRIISTVDGTGNLVVSGGPVALDYGIGAPASSTSAALAGPGATVAGSLLKLGANQTIRSLDAQTANAGDQEIDLAGHWVAVYPTDRAAAELGIYSDIKAAKLSASGKDGIYDSTMPASNYGIGVTDQARDAHNDLFVLVRLTKLGDANVDGFVDISDLGLLATSWQTSGLWDNGDFNYDNFIDISDLGMLATNWQTGANGPSFDQALASVGLAGVSVPEPGVVGLLGAAAAASLIRRRRST